MNDTGKVLVSHLTPETNKPLVHENSENKSITGKMFYSNRRIQLIYKILIFFLL